jgi:hypothetical protein
MTSSSLHFFVFSVAPGHFRHGLKLPKGAEVHGRFTTKTEARLHARQLKRDYLTPMFVPDGTPLTIRQRVLLGVWGNVDGPYRQPRAKRASAGL